MSKRGREGKKKFNAEALLRQMPEDTPPNSTGEGRIVELAEIFGDLDINYSTQQPKLKAKQTQTTPEENPILVDHYDLVQMMTKKKKKKKVLLHQLDLFL